VTCLRGQKELTDRPKCPRCNEKMLEIQPCHFICFKGCGGVLDCADTASGG